MLSKTVLSAFNEQIQKEYYSSYLYLAMSAYCEASNLPGSAKWMSPGNDCPSLRTSHNGVSFGATSKERAFCGQVAFTPITGAMTT